MHVPLSIVLASLALVSVAGGQATSGAVGLPAKIIYVDVGQGDAVVMRIGGKIIVSDTGQYDYDVLDRALRDQAGLGAKRIDVLILGHAHDDHSRNAAELLRKWEVGRVVMNESLWWGGTKSNKAVRAAIRAEPNLKRTFAVAGETFDWGGAKWVFANPPRGEFLDASSRVAGNSSLAFLLTVNGVTALFTGDIHGERRQERRGAPRPRRERPGRHLPRDPPRLEGGLDRRDPRRDPPSLGGALDREERLRAPVARGDRPAEGCECLDLVYGSERQRDRADLGNRGPDLADEPSGGALVVGEDEEEDRQLRRPLTNV